MPAGAVPPDAAGPVSVTGAQAAGEPQAQMATGPAAASTVSAAPAAVGQREKPFVEY